MGFHKAPDIECLHLKFVKQIVCKVRQQTTNATVYELERVQLMVSIVIYCFNISKCPNYLVYTLYNMCDINVNYINIWSNDVKTLLDTLGFSYNLKGQYFINFL